MPTVATGRNRRVYWAGFVLLVGAVAGVAYPTAQVYGHALSLLLRIEEGNAPGALARFDAYPVSETIIEIPSPRGPLHARMYTPAGIANPAGMVIVHGVHHLGIEEPRLVNFSRAIAAGGIEVLTPELPELADYHVAAKDVELIGEAARYLRQRTQAPVGVLGLSFAGGLSLLAAADPRFAPDIGFVVSVGGHDDLERVCRYLATGRIARPDGSVQVLPPHEYGSLVLVYSHVEEFFSVADAPIARDAIRLQLWEQMDAARERAQALSPQGRGFMQLLLEHKQEDLAPALLAKMPQHAVEMAAVSPHGHLDGLHVPVLILHGSGDSVIPATEALWLAHDVPAPYLRKVLISPLITHVEVGGDPSLADKAALLEFMSDMLTQVNQLPRRSDAMPKVN